jgi:WD40 repeat protein
MNFEKPDFHMKHVPDDRDPLVARGETDLGRRELLLRSIRFPAIFALLAGQSEVSGAVATLPQAHSSSVLALAMSPDGAYLASGSEGGFKLWNRTASQKDPIRLPAGGAEVCALAFSPDSSLVACGLRLGRIEVYKVGDRQVIKRWTGHAAKDVTGLAFSKDGTSLFSVGKDGSLSVWSLATYSLQQTHDGNAGVAFSVAVSEDGRWAAVAFDRLARLYAVRESGSLDPVGPGARGHTNTIADVTFAPGNLLATGSYDNTVIVRTTPDLRMLTTLTGHLGPVNALKWIPPGFVLASASDDKTVRLWSLRDLKQLDVLRGHQDFVVSLAVSPDGQTLYSGDASGTIVIWDLTQRKRIGYLFDPLATPPSFKGATYTTREITTGRMITYTLPCGSAIPPGATCLCNCVPGTYSDPETYRPPAPRVPTYAPIPVPGGTIRQPCTAQPVPPGYVCTCNCVPGY